MSVDRAIDMAVDLFKDWMLAERPIYNTGINGNANCMAKTLPLFQKFVQAYPDFWEKEFGYVPKGKAGQKSEHYITFTNKVLGPALEQLTGEPTVFDHKNTTTRRDMTMSVRAIRGWQDPSQIKVPNPNHKCRRLPVDDEMCECGDVTDFGEEPDYDIETLKLVATIAVVAEKATARKAKRSKRAATAKVDGPAAKKVCTEPSSGATDPHVPPCTLWAFWQNAGSAHEPMDH